MLPDMELDLMHRSERSSSVVPVGARTVTYPKHTRRLFDKLLIAFHQACDNADLEVAEHLLRLLELMTIRRPRAEDGDRRRGIESLVAAHERLCHMRHAQVVGA